MTLTVAIQMDPIEFIKPQTDTSLLLGLEAQARGHTLYYYTPDKLSLRDGKVTATAYPVTLHADHTHHYDLGEPLRLDLSTTDVVLLRQDPPFDMAYITTTHLLEQLPATTLVVNNPASVRNHPEKLFPAQFREFSPPTLVSADIQEIGHFRDEYKDIILKPLYGFGGHSVLRLKQGDDNFHTLMEMIFTDSREPWVIQQFIPDVKTGERRIILIDGAFGGIIGRIPPEGEIRANMRIGGVATKVELTPRQRDICAALEPELKAKGLILAGIDVIGDYLTEINLTSPTGLAPINRLYNTKLEATVWNAIEARL